MGRLQLKRGKKQILIPEQAVSSATRDLPLMFGGKARGLEHGMTHIQNLNPKRQ